MRTVWKDGESGRPAMEIAAPPLSPWQTLAYAPILPPPTFLITTVAARGRPVAS